MNYSEHTINEIINCNYKRLQEDDTLNKMMLFILIESDRNNIKVSKTHILNEFSDSKHTISSILRFMDGLGFIEIIRSGKENHYKITECGSIYLERFLNTEYGKDFYTKTAYYAK